MGLLHRHASLGLWKRGGCELLVRVEIIKPKLLCPAVHPVFFGDFLARKPLREARDHGFELREGGFSLGGVFGTMLFCEVADEVRTLQYDASAGGGGGQFTEILEER